MKMNERKKKVLLAIIQDYIHSAEPVGSRTISKKYNLKVSPATIRNEMADLEEMGLIEQPHTSAGRIPSIFGYRYYVDCLMERESLSNNEEEKIQRELNKKIKQMEDIIQQTSRLLSDLTKYTSLVDSPHFNYKAIKHVQLIPFKPLQALVVIVTETGNVIHRILPISESVTYDDLNRISEVLNQKMPGQSLETMQKTILHDIYADLVRQKKVLKVVLELLEQAMASENEGGGKVYLGGTLNILNQPEFKDVEKIKRILGILDEEEVVRHILAPTGNLEDGISIKIGTENHIDGFDGCSVITATYSINGEKVGTIGLLGPTRMNYGKAVAVVEAISKSLTIVLEKVYR